MGNRAWMSIGNLGTNLELYVATGEQSYLDAFNAQIFKALDRNVYFTLQTALDAVP